MLKEADFKIDNEYFHFKKDRYPLAKINGVRLKRMSLLDNLGQILFWLFLFSGAVWLAIPDLSTAPAWLIVIAVTLSSGGFIFALLRCSRFALQIEFEHIDETGAQWINVTKSYSSRDGELLEKQAESLKKVFV